MVEGLTTTLLFFAPGMIGGLVRGLAGISKNVIGKGKEFKFWSLFFTLIVAAVVGGVTGVIVGGDWRVSLLMGYAGSDMLEALYKTKIFSGFKKF